MKRLFIAQFLLTLSVYTFLSIGVILSHRFNPEFVSKMLIAHIIGIPTLGAITTYCVEHRRRNQSCVFAIVVCCVVVFYSCSYLDPIRLQTRASSLLPFLVLILSSCYSLAQRILQGTLLIDVVKSSSRPRAHSISLVINIIAVFFSPLLGMAVAVFSPSTITIAIIITMVSASLLTASVRFPFRSPADNVSFLTVDRFVYLGRWNYTILQILVSIIFGFLLVLAFSKVFISESLLILRLTPIVDYYFVLKVVCLIASFLAITLFIQKKYSKHLNHCLRTTIHNTQLLAIELGLSIGFFIALNLA